MGDSFNSIMEVKQKIKMLGTRWREKITPAILNLSSEMGKSPPRSRELNGQPSYN